MRFLPALRKSEPIMNAVRSVCVYCGAADRVAEIHRDSARLLGQQLGAGGYQVVYGGGRVGLMGLVADAALAAGGPVVGIIPEHIQAMEVEHRGLTELHVVDSMHTRKQMMVARSDAFIILPGGLGTMDEFFEIVTWRQLRLHEKPVIVCNIDGYWNPLRDLLSHLQATGFAHGPVDSFYRFVADVPAAMAALAGLAVNSDVPDLDLM
jgi:uncharacterized protein (TIGR00730 family)